MSTLEKFVHTYHTYERSISNKNIYRCTHPDCTHYKSRSLLEGKRAECPKCHELFILTYAKLRNKLPTCDACSKSPKAAELREAKALADSLIQDVSLPDELRSILE